MFTIFGVTTGNFQITYMAQLVFLLTGTLYFDLPLAKGFLRDFWNWFFVTSIAHLLFGGASSFGMPYLTNLDTSGKITVLTFWVPHTIACLILIKILRTGYYSLLFFKWETWEITYWSSSTSKWNPRIGLSDFQAHTFPLYCAASTLGQQHVKICSYELFGNYLLNFVQVEICRSFT